MKEHTNQARKDKQPDVKSKDLNDQLVICFQYLYDIFCDISQVGSENILHISNGQPMIQEKMRF